MRSRIRIQYKQDEIWLDQPVIPQALYPDDIIEAIRLVRPRSPEILTLEDLYDIRRDFKILIRNTMKEMSVNSRLDRIEAIISGTPIKEDRTWTREYPWADAGELGIKDKWDDKFFTLLDLYDYIISIVTILENFKQNPDEVRIVYDE